MCYFNSKLLLYNNWVCNLVTCRWQLIMARSVTTSFRSFVLIRSQLGLPIIFYLFLKSRLILDCALVWPCAGVFSGICSLLPCGCQASNSGPRIWQQVSFPPASHALTAMVCSLNPWFHVMLLIQFKYKLLEDRL